MRARWTCATLIYTCVALYSVQGSEKCEKRSPAVWHKQKETHRGIGLTDSELKGLAMLNDNRHFQSVLDPILVPRVPGTEGHTGVRNHIVGSMKTLGWTVEEDSFTDTTPHGVKPFTNIIATLDPNAARRIVLACHYDSKWDKDGIFIGATDSAVPCAMMINMAKTLFDGFKKHKLQCRKKKKKKKKNKGKGKKKTKFYKIRARNSSKHSNAWGHSNNQWKSRRFRKKDSPSNITLPIEPHKCFGRYMWCREKGKGKYNRTFIPWVQNDVTLQFLFLDGEEAFVQWSSTDSIYGARNLANKLEKSPFRQANQEGITELHRMDMFVLLDLIGTEDCQFFSLFESTDRWFQRLASFEQRLDAMNLLNRSTNTPLFKTTRRLYNSGIEDDHIPFMRKGVDILHLISVPFPSVWHKNSDHGGALHYPTMQNINMILRAFVADYLHLVV